MPYRFPRILLLFISLAVVALFAKYEYSARSRRWLSFVTVRPADNAEVIQSGHRDALVELLNEKISEVDFGLKDAGLQSSNYYQHVLNVLQDTRNRMMVHEFEERDVLNSVKSRVRTLDRVLKSCGKDGAANRRPSLGFELAQGSRMPPTWNPHRSLVALVVCQPDQQQVETLISHFGFTNFSYVLFKRDLEPWRSFQFANQVVTVHVPGQDKWWYLHRFLTVEGVEPYDYVFIWEPNVNVTTLQVSDFVASMRRHRVFVGQPGYSGIPSTSSSTGHWVDSLDMQLPLVFTRDAWTTFAASVLNYESIFQAPPNVLTHLLRCSIDKLAILDAFPLPYPSPPKYPDLPVPTDPTSSFIPPEVLAVCQQRALGSHPGTNLVF